MSSRNQQAIYAVDLLAIRFKLVFDITHEVPHIDGDSKTAFPINARIRSGIVESKISLSDVKDLLGNVVKLLWHARN